MTTPPEIESACPDPRRKLPVFGVIWIILSPVIFLMAAISTVKSLTIYHVQLAVFSTVSLVGLVAGIGALFRQVWAGRSLLILSLIATTCSCGSALLIFLWPFLPWTAAEFHWLIPALSLMIASTGAPFLLMARSLRRTLKAISRSSKTT